MSGQTEEARKEGRKEGRWHEGVRASVLRPKRKENYTRVVNPIAFAAAAAASEKSEIATLGSAAKCEMASFFARLNLDWNAELKLAFFSYSGKRNLTAKEQRKCSKCPLVKHQFLGAPSRNLGFPTTEIAERQYDMLVNFWSQFQPVTHAVHMTLI